MDSPHAGPIASATVDLIHSDGRRVTGSIWLGLPYTVDEHEARCPCGIGGLDGRLADIGGSDKLQALILTARVLANRLSDFVKKGGRIVYPRTDDEVDLEPLFGKWVSEAAASYREGEQIHIQLSRDEALVLFEWLAQHDGSLTIEDKAEQDVLWQVEGRLERVLEPLSPDYRDLLAAARKRVRERE